MLSRSPTRFFSCCTGAGVRVAVIDSGVHAPHPHVGGVAGGIGIGPAGALQDDYVDRLGHGTAVAAAIREKAPDTELWAVKVFDRDLATAAEALVGAIGWAASRGAHLINLSLGTANPAHESMLSEAVAAAGARGVFVVAAAEDEGTRWLPGSLDGVVPVRLDWRCPRDEYRVADEGGRIVFLASGYPRGIPGVRPERNLKGLSFAVANMTGFAARALEGVERGALDELTTRLARAAVLGEPVRLKPDA